MNSIRFSGIPIDNINQRQPMNNQRQNRAYGPYRKKKYFEHNNPQRSIGQTQNPGRYVFSSSPAARPGISQNIGSNQFSKSSDQIRPSFLENSSKNSSRPNRPYFSDPLILSRVSQVGMWLC